MSCRVASTRQHFLHFSFGIVKLPNKNNVVKTSQSEKLFKSFAAALEKKKKTHFGCWPPEQLFLLRSVYDGPRHTRHPRARTRPRPGPVCDCVAWFG